MPDDDTTCSALRATSESVKHKIAFGTTYCMSPAMAREPVERK